MRSASTFGYLVVISALAWAAMPMWGWAAMLAVLVLLAVATRRMVRNAREALEPHFELLAVTDDEGRNFLRRYALTFLWPEAAERWMKPWIILGPLGIFLGVVFIGRAFFAWNFWFLAMLFPIAVMVVIGGTLARFLDMKERLLTDLAPFKTTWDQAMMRASLRRAMRVWPPVQAPDEVPTSTPPSPPELP